MFCKAGLVLEGGGSKGVFTSGVLDFFLDQDLDFVRIYGASAGANNAASFIAKQRGRSFATFEQFMGRWDFASWRSLLLTGDFFNVKMCYHKIPEELLPLDFETAAAWKGQFYAVVTNVRTGRPEYLRVSDLRKGLRILQASGALPLVARRVQLGEDWYLDGCLTDPVPIDRCIRAGSRKNVVVLTKQPGYRRHADPMLPFIKAAYRKYPSLLYSIEHLPERYNRMLDGLAVKEDSGEAFVIRPADLHGVGRFQVELDQLKALYDEGYRTAEACWPALRDYLGISGISA